MNEHSAKFELVKSYYEAGAWKKSAVKKAVAKGWITESEYTEVTDEPYSA